MKAKLLVSILTDRRAPITAFIGLLAYVVLYLAAMQYLIVAPAGSDPFFGLQIVPRWQDLVFRQRAPFLFEPVGALHLGPVILFLSVPNIIIGLVLGILVAANIAVSYYGFHALGMRGVRGMHALIGTIPALVSGAACCVPTLILVIGLQLTATLATIWSLLVPVSVFLLVVSLWWLLHRMPAERVCDISPRAVCHGRLCSRRTFSRSSRRNFGPLSTRPPARRPLRRTSLIPPLPRPLMAQAREEEGKLTRGRTEP